MGTEVERRPGPDYRQANMPDDATIGKMWFNSDGGNCAMANGFVYGGIVGSFVGTAGYHPGGQTPGPNYVSTVDKLMFSSDTNNTITSNLHAVRTGGGVEDGTRGWVIGGGANGTVDSIIDRLTFDTDAIASVTSTLVTSRDANVGTMFSEDKGYACGGIVVPPSTVTTTTDTILFADESVGQLASGLPTSSSTYYTHGFSAPTKGYVKQGPNTGSGTIQAITFSDDSIASVTSDFGTLQYHQAAVNADGRGYVLGGYYSAGPRSHIFRLNFSDESTAVILNIMSAAVTYGQGYNSLIAGYRCGNQGAGWDDIDRLVFSTETAASLAATLSQSMDGSSRGFEDLATGRP